jgi:hypothetical protein
LRIGARVSSTHPTGQRACRRPANFIVAGQAPQRQPYRCPSFSIGGLAPGVDLTKANQLAAALEDELLIEKLRQGR